MQKCLPGIPTNVPLHQDARENEEVVGRGMGTDTDSRVTRWSTRNSFCHQDPIGIEADKRGYSVTSKHLFCFHAHVLQTELILYIPVQTQALVISMQLFFYLRSQPEFNMCSVGP